MVLVAFSVVLVIVALMGIMHVIRLVPVVFVLVALMLVMVMCCACHCNLLFKAVLRLSRHYFCPQRMVARPFLIQRIRSLNK